MEAWLMSYLKQVFACVVCDFREQLENLQDRCGDLRYCPNCKKGGEYHVLLPLKKYLEQKRKEDLAKQIFCRNCGCLEPVENFQFDFPPEEDGERRCPQCGSDRGINASNLPLCASCRQLPVEKAGDLCVGCEEMYEAAYVAEQDSRDIF
jgi:hypothetical protein